VIISDCAGTGLYGSAQSWLADDCRLLAEQSDLDFRAMSYASSFQFPMGRL